MRVLLINTNRETAPDPVVPAGMAAVASAVEAAGHEVGVLDLCFTPRRQIGRTISRTLRGHRPDVVGLSIRNLDNCDALNPRSYLPEAAAVAERVREGFAGPLVIGGPAVGVAPGGMLEEVGADFAVAGEGERSFVGLLAALEEGQQGQRVPGVLARGSGGPPPEVGHGHPGGCSPEVGHGHSVSSAAAGALRPADLDALAPVSLQRWIDLDPYLRRGATVPVQTKRGCAFRCTYCTYRQLEGSRYRSRSPEGVMAELAPVARRWPRAVFEVVDATFNHPLEHALRLCETIASSEASNPWTTLSVNPSETSLELFRLMRRAGFTGVGCTPESASEQMLDRLEKGFGRQQLVGCARQLTEAGMPTLYMFLLGGPGETEETVEETLAFITDHLGPRDLAFVTVGMRVYPGTPVASRLAEQGWLEPGADLLAPRFYCSPHLDLASLEKRLRRAQREQRKLLLVNDTLILDLAPVRWLLRALGSRPPHWRHPLLQRLFFRIHPFFRARQARLAGAGPA